MGLWRKQCECNITIITSIILLCLCMDITGHAGVGLIVYFGIGIVSTVAESRTCKVIPITYAVGSAFSSSALICLSISSQYFPRGKLDSSSPNLPESVVNMM